MAKVTITVCDMCRDTDRSTTTYRIGKVGALRTVDLCDEHANPLEKIIAAASDGRRTANPRRRTFNETVTTIEEIEARKKQAKRA